MSAIKNINPAFDGTVEYAGLRFGPFRSVTSQVSPVYDETGRVVTDSEISITVHAVITGANAGDTEVAMTSAIQRLGESGGRLLVSGIGMLTPIDSMLVPDTNFGPKPNLISLRPLGAELAWEVVWSVVYRRPPLLLGGKVYPTGAIHSANWDIEFSANDQGLVTRSVSGFVQLFVKAAGAGGDANGNAANVGVATVDVGKTDNVFLGAIRIPKPPFMRRVSAKRHITAAKNRVDFSVVDEEFADGPFPDGMTDAEAEMTIENNPPGFVNWSASLTASFTVAPGLPKSLAAQRWFILLFDAAAKARAAVKDAKGVVIPERFRITVPKIGRTCRFGATWRMVACLHDILLKTGLWEPIPGTSYASWNKSMDDIGVGSFGGISNLQAYGSETLVSLGSETKTIDVGWKGQHPDRVNNYSQQLLCPEVTAETSYLSWENSIRGAQEANAIIHRPMQKALIGSAVASGAVGGGVTGAVTAGLTALFSQPQTGLKEDVVQVQGKTDNYVIMSGKSLRLKFAPEIPSLVKVAGVKVTELARNVEVKPITGFFDCALLQARWTILYRVVDQIYGVIPPANKHMCFTEGENDGHNGPAAGGAAAVITPPPKV